METALEQAAAVLPERVRRAIGAMPREKREQVLEVRLYAASPVRLTTHSAPLFLSADGGTQYVPSDASLRVSRAELEETVLCACGYSLHSVREQLRAGFLPLTGGHRLAVCGMAVARDDGAVQALSDVTSLNLRVARFLPDAASLLCRTLFRNGLCSPILVGPPMSGKTTMLRALAHSLSTGRCGTYYRVSVLDTRQEFSPLPFCDVLCGADRAQSIDRALRLLSPQMIVCDEIADVRETAALERGFAAGCACAVSVHADTQSDLLSRAPLRALLAAGQFTHVVLLDPDAPERVRSVCTPQSLCA